MFLVRAEGLEPPRFSPPEPKSGASTNSATPADAPPRHSRCRLGRLGLYSNGGGRAQQKTLQRRDRRAKRRCARFVMAVTEYKPKARQNAGGRPACHLDRAIMRWSLLRPRLSWRGLCSFRFFSI